MSRPSYKGLSLGQTMISLKKMLQDGYIILQNGYKGTRQEQTIEAALYHMAKLRKIIGRLEAAKRKLPLDNQN